MNSNNTITKTFLHMKTLMALWGSYTVESLERNLVNVSTTATEANQKEVSETSEEAKYTSHLEMMID